MDGIGLLPRPDRLSNPFRPVMINASASTVGSRFTTGLRSRICGCESNRRKTSTIYMVKIEICLWVKQISQIIL